MTRRARDHLAAAASDPELVYAEEAALDHVDHCTTCIEYGRLSWTHCSQARHLGLARLAAFVHAINAAARELPA